VKGTRWILSTDGFDYSERGLVVDSLSFCENPKLRGDVPFTKLPNVVPFARLSKNDFLWLGEISPGMTKDEVMQILKRKSLPILTTQEGCEISAQGFYALSSINTPLRKWSATLHFSDGSLSALHLNASPDWKP
jgi:hypothetical protein